MEENRFAPYHPGLLGFTLDKIQGISLEDSIRAIQGKGRKVRDLVGPASIMERTLGMDDVPFNEEERQIVFRPYEPRRTYEDDGKESSTEFAEALDALAACELRSGRESAVAALLETGDVLYQQGVMRLSHPQDVHRKWAEDQFSRALGFLMAKLQERGLSLDDAEHLTIVKYATRGVILSTDREKLHVMPNKDKHFEDALCRYAFERRYGNRAS